MHVKTYKIHGTEARFFFGAADKQVVTETLRLTSGSGDTVIFAKLGRPVR